MAPEHQNRGLGAARNTGFAAATAPLVLPLDGDDLLTPDCLSKLLALLERNPEADCVYPDYELFGAESGVRAHRLATIADMTWYETIHRMFELPRIIQGGMGVGVSNWRLANAVSRLGQLGVVSGTALDALLVRRLADEFGHVIEARDKAADAGRRRPHLDDQVADFRFRDHGAHDVPARPVRTRIETEVWEPRYYDFNVYTIAKLKEKLHYIHRNPVRAGLVQRPSDWPWSSFSFYLRGSGLITMDPCPHNTKMPT